MLVFVLNDIFSTFFNEIKKDKQNQLIYSPKTKYFVSTKTKTKNIFVYIKPIPYWLANGRHLNMFVINITWWCNPTVSCPVKVIHEWLSYLTHLTTNITRLKTASKPRVRCLRVINMCIIIRYTLKNAYN